MKTMKFSIGDLFVFNTTYCKDIGVIVSVTKKDVTICWHSTNNQTFLVSTLKDFLTKREHYFYYPVVK